MELSKVVLSLYFVGGVFSISFLIAFLFEEVKRINFSIVLFLLFLAWWSFGFYFGNLGNNQGQVSIWMGIANLGFTLIPVTFYSLVAVLLGKEKKYLILTGYFVSILFTFFSFANLYYINLDMAEGIGFFSKANFIYIFYIIFVYFGFFILGIREILVEMFRKDSREIRVFNKNILFLSVIILFLSVANFPLWYGIDMLPYCGVLAIFACISLVVHIVFKYDLVNKKAFYAQSLLGLILSINAIEIFFSENVVEQTYKSVMLIFLMVFSNILIKSYKEDISQREILLKMSKKLEANNKKLKELDNAKNEFISIVAHQLRTPPTVIKGYLNLAKDDPNNKLDEVTKDSLSRALVSNDRLIELVEDILNISRIESGKMQYDFQPNQSIEKLIVELKENFEVRARDHGLKLKLDIPNKKVPYIVMDSKKIRAVLSNLIDNAIKYTSKGSITIKYFTKNRNVVVEVIDTGIGISKKEMGNLFKKFSRGDNADQLGSGGIGLGIYVGRKIVEAHQGKIWVDSLGTGKGSTFIVELPIEGDSK